MSSASCIFCQIVKKEIPKDVVYEDSEIGAFEDIHPVAPVHILIIPKRHIESVNELQKEDRELAGNMILAAKGLARKLKISQDGYKLLFRTGKHGGQEVEHLHLHLIGGAKLYEEIRPI